MDAPNGAFKIFTILLTFGALTVASGVLTGKAFYCRDPDTGKLYPVNTTWPSSTFCGKFTCKLRKKISDSPLQTVLSKYKNNNNADSAEVPKQKDLHKNCSQPVGVIVEDKTAPDIHNISHKFKVDTNVNNEKSKNAEDVKNVDLTAKTKDGDRYLTEEEITALSLLLQTMKKSDLEAILEVYNLAQDIYREIDKVTEEKINSSILKESKEVLLDKNPKENEIPSDIKNKKIISYWYEPLTAIHSKSKATDVIGISKEQEHAQPFQVRPNAIPKSFYEGLHLLEEAKLRNKLFESMPSIKIHDKSYIEPPLAGGDFRKLPYYHPMTSFQRQAAYVRPAALHSQSKSASAPIVQPNDYIQQALYARPTIYNPAVLQIQPYPQMQYPQNHREEFVQQIQDKNAMPKTNVAPLGKKQPNKSKYCKNKQPELLFKIIPWKKPTEDRKRPMNMKYEDRLTLYQPEVSNDGKGSVSYSEAKMKPNFDLPMAYVHDYNNLSSIRPYNIEKTWRLLGLSEENHRRNNPPYLGDPFLARAPNKLPTNSEESPEMNDEEQEQVQNSKIDTLQQPDWQTAQLPTSVLNEVKANIARSNILPYPFRKKVNIERVGKFMKMEEAGRRKRDAEAKYVPDKKPLVVPEEYEVYIEKSTCETDTEPGFFRMGNLTEPYPACCPQRIKS